MTAEDITVSPDRQVERRAVRQGDRQKLERRGILVSMIGAVVMCVFGLVLALQTGSAAIMLDSVFSGIGFFMALLTLWVSSLIHRPDDERFQFGYAHFAPLLNVLKSGLMVAICAFAGLNALRALLGGGRELAVGAAVLYGAVASGLGLMLAIYLGHLARRSGSALVRLDANGAVVDMLLSFAILAAFVAGYFIADGPYDHWLPYLDPTLVVVLCLVSIPVPLKVLYDNAREALLMAPSSEVQQQVRERIAGALDEHEISDFRIRQLKTGNTLAVIVHIQPGEGGAMTLDAMDQWRDSVGKALATFEEHVTFDLVFVGDMVHAD